MPFPNLPGSVPSSAQWAARLGLAAAAIAIVAGPNGWLYFPITPTSYDHQRLLMVVGLLISSLLSVLTPGLRQETGATWARLPPWVRFTLAGFFILGLFSALRAPIPIAAFVEWGVFLLGTIAALAIAGSRQWLGREADGVLIALLLAGVILYAGDFLAFYLPTVWKPEVSIFWDTPFFHFGNVRFFNQFQTWTLPLLAGAVVLAGIHNRSLRAVLLLVGAFWWALAFATGGRGVLISATISTLLVLLIFKGKGLRWLGATATLAGAGGVIYGLLFHLPGTSPGVGRAVTQSAGLDQARIRLWAEALEETASHPFLGVGPMQYASGNPHNALLQLAAEWGIPAALGACAIVLAGIWGWSRQWRPRSWQGPEGTPSWAEAIPPALTGSLLAGLGHSMVSGIIVTPVSQALTVIVAGWLLGIHQALFSPSSGTALYSRRKESLGISLAAVVGMAALAPGFLFTLPDLATSHRNRATAGEGPLVPRFWLQGNLCLPPWPATVGIEKCPEATPEKKAEPPS